MDGIIIVDKPQNMTSFDVVNQIKRRLHAKVGHSGTLDPMATGILVIAINRATKSLAYMGVEDKVYRARMILGTATHTGDIWGDVIQQQAIPTLDLATVLETVMSFKGAMKQRVPKVSAKKIDGKRSYQYVLDNEAVVQLYTDIVIHDIQLISFVGNEIEFEAKVSNGTYIRTLCEDIALALGSVGTMSALRRIQVGQYTLDDAVNLEDVSDLTPLISTKAAIGLPCIERTDALTTIRDGKRLEIKTEHDRVLVDGGPYYAVYEREHDDIFKSVRGLW